MVFARVLFMLGSVLALFGAWRLIAPYIYQTVAANPVQGVLFLAGGLALLWIGRQLERRQNPGA